MKHMRIWALLACLVTATDAEAKTICTALADVATGEMLFQEGTCDRRVTAASTFKIAISLMGYDSGFLIDEKTPVLPFHKGYPDWIPAWRTSQNPEGWIKNSVVWYSQQITQSLGKERFGNYVKAMHYGSEDVSGDPGKDNGLTRSWLSSSLKISPLEQLRFLSGVVRREFPLSAHAYEMTGHIIKVADLADGWQVYGKTGSGSPRNADGSLANRLSYGWFVGWATRNGKSVAFARLIQNDGKRESISMGLQARAALLKELPSLLPKS